MSFLITKFLFKTQNINSILILWVLIIFIGLSITNFPTIPQRTHDLAALMFNSNCIDCGLGHLINSLIASPSYIILKYFFVSLKNYFIIQCIFFLISISVFYVIFIKISSKKNYYLISKISLILILFILILNFIGGNWSNVFEHLAIGVNYFNYNFSTRSILSISYFISCYFLITNRISFAGAFILIGMLSHPTNGLVIFLSVIGLLIMDYFKNLFIDRSDYKKLLGFLLVGLLPVLYKMFSLEGILLSFPIENVSSKEYIMSMYRDEIDDFSAIYYISSAKFSFTSSLLFSLTPVVISYFIKNELTQMINIKILSSLIITPFIIFFIILIIETTYLNFGFPEFILEKVINSQLGLRILKYIGIPAVLIYMIIINQFLNFNSYNSIKSIKKYLDIICFVLLIFISSLIFNNNFKSKFKKFNNLINNKSKYFSDYGRMAYYEDLLEAGYDKISVNERFLYDCKCGNIYNKKIDSNDLEMSKQTLFSYSKTYDNNIDVNFKYNNYFLRKDIIIKINEKLNIGSKIITPPYLYCFREFLPNYDIYFQEHDDGNFMLGSKKIYERFKPRMSMLSFSYLNLPSQVSELMTNEIRKNWLNLNRNDFELIKKQGFKYVITESIHEIDLQIVHQDSNWKIYKIN